MRRDGKDGSTADSLVVILCGLLPGMLAGVEVGSLLFFLNPNLPFSRWTVLEVVFPYALLGGAISLLLHLPFTHNSKEKAWRVLPWGLSGTLIFSAILAGYHASHFAYYLPPGINIRLLKATISLSVAGLITFYTALLHTLHRRPYGWKSRVGFVFLCLLAVYAMVERREAFRPTPESVRASSFSDDPSRPRVVVVALEGATLEAILPLAEEGRLPFLGAALRDGASGRLEALTPYRRAPLWTSLATGKHPFQHGIIGDEVYPASNLGPRAELKLLPAGIAFQRWGTFGAQPRPVHRGDSRALSLWQIFSRLGLSTGTVGWPVTAPAPEDLAFSLSERFFQDPSLPTGALPSELAERARLFRVGVDEVDEMVAERFGRKPPPVVLEALAEDGWRRSLSLFLLEDRQTDIFALTLPGLGSVSEEFFGGFAMVHLLGQEREGAAEAAECVAAYYAELDRFLQELWQTLQEPTILAVISPYGAERLRGSERWMRWTSGRGPFASTRERSPDGVIFLLGPGIRPGARLTGAKLEDLAPTLLYALGFPVARDFDGKVLTAAFEPGFLNRQALSFVPSYEALSGTASSGR